MLEHRRVLTWLWRAWGSTPLVVGSGSLLIGYLRTSQGRQPILDSLECLVGLGFSGLVCVPLLIAACYLHRHTRTRPSSVPRWLVWVPLACVMPLALVMFVTYLFGELGISIRTFTTSIFETREAATAAPTPPTDPPSAAPVSPTSPEPAPLPRDVGCWLPPWAPPGPDAEALFILVGDDSSASTYWVERNGRATRWLGWSPSAIFTWNGGVWRAGSEHHEGKTAGCPSDPDMRAGPGTSTLEHLVLSRLDAPGRIEPLGPPKLPSGSRDASSESRVIALLGPYLFIRSTDDADDCGAHGNDNTSVKLVHLGTLRSPRLTLPPTIAAQAKSAALAYQQEMDAPGLPQVQWDATLPSLTSGKLGATFVFVTNTNYVASDWGSYRHAVFVEGPLPPELAGFASIPTLLTTLKCDLGQVRGFTRAPPGALENEALKRAFQPVPPALP